MGGASQDRRLSTQSNGAVAMGLGLSPHPTRRRSQQGAGAIAHRTPSITPPGHHHHQGRVSLLAMSLGISGSGSVDWQAPSVSSLGDDDGGGSADWQPSATALRLRSLARSVRAAQTLGTLKVRNKYLASAPMAAAGSPTAAAVELLGPLPSRGVTRGSRVIALPTHEFSTEEMKFRLEPLDATASGWRLDDGGGGGGGPETSDATGGTSPPAHGIGTARSTKGTNKVRWKNALVKAAPAPGTKAGPATTALNSPFASLGGNNGLGATHGKRPMTSAAGDHHLGFPLGGGSHDGLHPPTTYPEEITDNLEARLYCARSFYKLSCQPESELAIIRGGAIAQLAEVSDYDHRLLQELCAATLANLTCNPDAVDVFVAHDGIPALLELSWSRALSVKIMCATALSRIASRAVHAAGLAKCRAMVEFMAMMAIPSEELQMLAITSIVNMIYFGHSFPERVFLGDPHAVPHQQGIMNIVTQLAQSLTTMHFAAGVLFNLALYRFSCAGALRGGGGEILLVIAVQASKALDEHSGSGSTKSLSGRTPRLPMAEAMNLLRLIAETLANFSAHVEFHGSMSASVTKTLSFLLQGALRDLGSRYYSGQAEERLRILAVPCSRAFANFSSNEDVGPQIFTQELVQLVTRLFLIDHTRLLSLGDSVIFTRNALRSITNLSFHEHCTAQIMEFPQVLPNLSRLIVLEKPNLPPSGPRVFESAATPESVYDDCCHSSDCGSDDEMREDALIAILNLARQGPYSQELLRTLDGKALANTAGSTMSSRRLKYVYTVVVCNLLFETRLQQILYGDLVVNALVDGFSFFSSAPERVGDPFHASDPCFGEATAYKTQNLAFPDDQERFLSAICTVAGELTDPRNIDRLVELSLNCLRLPEGTKTTCQQRARRRPISAYAAATLYTLARSCTQRGDTTSRIYGPETESVLIDVCERAALGQCLNADGRQQQQYFHCGHTQAFCAASLYHLCASGWFNARIIQALITTCNGNEESLSLLACAASFAIISFSPEGRQQLVQAPDLARALNRLGRTSQVETQQYAAIAACNVSAVQCVWSSTELKDFIVVALLRANSVQAKQIHAKTLANLLAHLNTRAKAVEDGVLYALLKLSQVMLSPSGNGSDDSRFTTTAAALAAPTQPLVFAPVAANERRPASPHANAPRADPMDEVFSLGLQVLFNLSCDHQYHAKLLSNGVMTYLAAAVTGKQSGVTGSGAHGTTASMATFTSSSGASSATIPGSGSPAPSGLMLASGFSVESRRNALGIMCNLSSYEENHKDLIHAQVTEVLRSYVDYDTESRASAAMTLRNLSCQQPWVEMICDRRTLALLVVFTYSDHPVVKHLSIHALANCSLVVDSLHLFGELKVARAVIVLLEATLRVASSPNKATLLTTTSSTTAIEALETGIAALKCLHNLAVDDILAQNLMEENAILRLLPLLEKSTLGESAEACLLAAKMISILASKARCAEALLRQRTVSFCALVHRKHSQHVEIAHECVAILMRLSTYQQILGELTETQAIPVVVSICSSACGCVKPQIRELGAIAIRNLTLSVTEYLSVFYDEAEFEGELLAQQRHRLHLDSRMDKGGVPTIGRLIERHLLEGVAHFQKEIVRYLPDGITTETACVTTNRVLLEAAAAIANLSTLKGFRVAMVDTGVIQTLLRVFDYCHHFSTVPAIIKAICSTTLHRLAMEDGATVDGRGLLVPGLLDILQQSDGELHQVRYECEKVSFPSMDSDVSPATGDAPSTAAVVPTPARGPSTSPQRISARPGDTSSSTSPSVRVGNQATAPSAPRAMFATTTCVRQSYRDSKWMINVVKTSLSSATMVPQLEKKQIRAIGLPRLSFFDLECIGAKPGASSSSSSSASAGSGIGSGHDSGDPTTGANVASEPTSHGNNGASEGPSGLKRNGGYLLPTPGERFARYLPECVYDADRGVLPTRTSSSSSSSSRGATTPTTTMTSRSGSTSSLLLLPGESAADAEAQLHSQKFDRHMRLARRNQRRTNVLPVLTFV